MREILLTLASQTKLQQNYSFRIWKQNFRRINQQPQQRIIWHNFSPGGQNPVLGTEEKALTSETYRAEGQSLRTDIDTNEQYERRDTLIISGSDLPVASQNESS